jgi:hypothetical protein
VHSIILALVPLGELIEDNIVGDMNTSYSWIIGLISLGSQLIAHENHPGAAII